jgi:integrase
VLRSHGRPVQKAAALTLTMPRQILATCDTSARGRRDRALLLFGFVGALRRSELVALHVEDVALVAGGLRLRIRRGKTDQAGQGAEIGLPRGGIRRPAPCGRSRRGRRWPDEKPVRYFEESAPGMGSATLRCIPTRFEGSWRTASGWPGLLWTGSTG